MSTRVINVDLPTHSASLVNHSLCYLTARHTDRKLGLRRFQWVVVCKNRPRHSKVIAVWSSLSETGLIEREISKASSLFLSNSSFFLATMSTQRVFTALEVAEMLQNDEDDDWLFAGRSGPVDTSEEEDDDDTGDVRRSHPPSMEVDSSSDSEDDISNHYLDAEVSVARLAEFIDLHVDSRGASADQQSAGTQPGDQVQVRCGCSQECLKKVEWEAVEANRFTMLELEKGQKDVLVLALMNSGMFAEETNARNKKRKNRVGFQYTFEGQVVCAGAFRFIYHLGSRELIQFEEIFHLLCLGKTLACSMSGIIDSMCLQTWWVQLRKWLREICWCFPDSILPISRWKLRIFLCGLFCLLPKTL